MNRNFLYTSALLIAGGFLFHACSTPDSIGIEVQPEGSVPGVYFTDTITLEANTVIEDSLRSDEAVAAFNLVGSYTDPVFSLSRASFYSEIHLPNGNYSFGSNPILDSVVLSLAYADYYGDTTTPMQIEVFQTDEKMYVDSGYYTHNSLLLGQMLYSGMVDVRPKDSIEVSGALRGPHLRLALDSTFGADFITSAAANFTDNTIFTDYFKGIHVKASDVTAVNQGVIMSFDLRSSLTKLTFYYKNGTDTTQKAAYFEVSSTCSRFNHFEHDYSMATFGNSFPVPGDDRLYVQSMSGVKVRITFPYLKNFAINGPVAINKAELVISTLDNSEYENHQNLLVFGVDSAGKEALIPDLLESSGYYGGGYTETDNTYKFNLARYIQRVISGKTATDYGVSLIGSGGATSAFRTIIPGTSPSSGNRIKLNLTFSKLD